MRRRRFRSTRVKRRTFSRGRRRSTSRRRGGAGRLRIGHRF